MSYSTPELFYPHQTGLIQIQRIEPRQATPLPTPRAAAQFRSARSKRLHSYQAICYIGEIRRIA